MHWGYGIFARLTRSPVCTFLHTFFTHFYHIYSFSWLIDMVILFQGACYRTSYFPPHFLGPISPWISVLGIGYSTPVETQTKSIKNQGKEALPTYSKEKPSEVKK